MLAGWIDRHQQTVTAYQKEEIKVLREMLGGKRLRFTDEQRRRLALKAQALSRNTLKNLGPLVTPDTLCRWIPKVCRREVRQQWTAPTGPPTKTAIHSRLGGAACQGEYRLGIHEAP